VRYTITVARQLAVPRTNTTHVDRSFAVHGPSVWNSLPAELRSEDMSVGSFQSAPEDVSISLTVTVELLTQHI